MIDPSDITNFERTDEELQEFFIFCWFSKAAKADQVASKLNSLFSHLYDVRDDQKLVNNIDGEPLDLFQLIRYALEADILRDLLAEFKVGKYEEFMKAEGHFDFLNLRYIPLKGLLRIPGVGPKIARMFLLHSRRGQKLICLDTHLLKEAGKLGFKVPKTISPNKYIEIEEFMFEKTGEIDCYAKYDLEKWKSYAIKE